MAKKRLFRETDEKWTEEALQLENELFKVIKPIFNKYVKKGYSVRDMQLVMEGAIISVCLDELPYECHRL